MRARQTFAVLTVAVAMMVTAACSGDGRQQPMAMQPTMDSVKMWYAQMQGDSMEACSQRIAYYLRQHQDDRSARVRRLRAEWLKARGVWWTAIKGRPDSGLVYTERALAAMEGLDGVDSLRVLALANRADFYRQTGRLDRSADGYLRALEVADSTGLDDAMRVPLMLGISTAYTFMGDYASATDWWQRTRRLLPQMNRADQFIYYNNVGNSHYFQQQYAEARDCFVQAASLVQGDTAKLWDYYTALANLGEIYVCLGQADSARLMTQQADSFFRVVDFQPLVYYITTTRMELAMLEGRWAEAQQMADATAADEVTIPAARVLRLKALEQLMRQSGRWQQAYDVHRQLHELNDSIQTANTRMQMSAQLMQYEHDKRLAAQRRTIDHERMTARLAWALLALAVLAILLLVILLAQRRRRQRLRDLTVRQQIVSLRMENTRNRITPHFTYNALSHEMLAQMEGRKVDLSALTQLLRRGIEQTDVLQTTLQEELTFVDYYVEIEGRQMGEGFHYVKEIAAEVATDAVRLPSMTLQIFVENAIKHGLRRQGGTLTIRAVRQGKATLVEVVDDGQGLGPAYREQTGMRVVRQTIQLLNEHNRQQITFGIGNLEKGCRSWVLLPDDYDYQLRQL